MKQNSHWPITKESIVFALIRALTMKNKKMYTCKILEVTSSNSWYEVKNIFTSLILMTITSIHLTSSSSKWKLNCPNLFLAKTHLNLTFINNNMEWWGPKETSMVFQIWSIARMENFMKFVQIKTFRNWKRMSLRSKRKVKKACLKSAPNLKSTRIKMKNAKIMLKEPIFRL